MKRLYIDSTIVTLFQYDAESGCYRPIDHYHGNDMTRDALTNLETALDCSEYVVGERTEVKRHKSGIVARVHFYDVFIMGASPCKYPAPVPMDMEESDDE